MADNTQHLIPGGKSMSGEGASPRINFRLPAELKDRLDLAAQDAGMSTGKYLRRIVEDWAAQRG